MHAGAGGKGLVGLKDRHAATAKLCLHRAAEVQLPQLHLHLKLSAQCDIAPVQPSDQLPLGSNKRKKRFL